MAIQINSIKEITNADNVYFNNQVILEVYKDGNKVYDKERWKTVAENLELTPNTQTSQSGTWTDDVFDIPGLKANTPTRITCKLETDYIFVFIGGTTNDQTYETWEDSITESEFDTIIKHGAYELIKFYTPTVDGKLPYSVYGWYLYSMTTVGYVVITQINQIRPTKLSITKIEQYY